MSKQPQGVSMHSNNKHPKWSKKSGACKERFLLNGWRCCGHWQPPWTGSPFFGGVGTGACNGNRKKWSFSGTNNQLQPFFGRTYWGWWLAVEQPPKHKGRWTRTLTRIFPAGLCCGRSSPDERRKWVCEDEDEEAQWLPAFFQGWQALCWRVNCGTKAFFSRLEQPNGTKRTTGGRPLYCFLLVFLFYICLMDLITAIGLISSILGIYSFFKNDTSLLQKKKI